MSYKKLTVEELMKKIAKEAFDEAVDLYSYRDEETDWHFEEWYNEKYGLENQ